MLFPVIYMQYILFVSWLVHVQQVYNSTLETVIKHNHLLCEQTIFLWFKAEIHFVCSALKALTLSPMLCSFQPDFPRSCCLGDPASSEENGERLRFNVCGPRHPHCVVAHSFHLVSASGYYVLFWLN